MGLIEARRMPFSHPLAGVGRRLWAQCNHLVTTGMQGVMQILHGVMRSYCDAPDWADLAEAYCTIFTAEPTLGSGPPP